MSRWKLAKLIWASLLCIALGTGGYLWYRYHIWALGTECHLNLSRQVGTFLFRPRELPNVMKLSELTRDPKVLLCPACRGEYVYRRPEGGPWYMQPNTPPHMIAWCPEPCHKSARKVLFEDGTVRTVPESEFQRAIDTGFILETQPASESGGQESPGRRVNIALTTSIGSGLMYIAKEQGFFRDQGVDARLTLVHFLDEVTNGLRSRSYDLSVEDTDFFTQQLASGLPVASVLLLDESAGYDGIIADSQIGSVADLKGKTITCQVPSQSYLFLLYALSAHGLSSNDVTITSKDYGSPVPFFNGEADAAMTHATWFVRARERGHILLTTKDMPGVIAETLVVRSELTEQPVLVQRLVASCAKAARFLERDQGRAIRIMARNLDVTEATVLRVLDGYRFIPLSESCARLGGQGPRAFTSALAETVRLYKQAGLIAPDATVDVTKAVRPDYARMVAEQAATQPASRPEGLPAEH